MLLTEWNVLCNRSHLLYNNPKIEISACTGGECKNSCTLCLFNRQTSSAFFWFPQFYYHFRDVISCCISSDKLTSSFSGSCDFLTALWLQWAEIEWHLSGTAGGGRNMDILVTVSLLMDILVTILIERFSNCVIQKMLHMARSGFKNVWCRDNFLASGQRANVFSLHVCYPQVVEQMLPSRAGSAVGRTRSATWDSNLGFSVPYFVSLWNEFLARARSAGCVFAQQFSFLWKHEAFSKVPLCPSAAIPSWMLLQVWTVDGKNLGSYVCTLAGERLPAELLVQ